jgi:hypothetical protein
MLTLLTVFSVLVLTGDHSCARTTFPEKSDAVGFLGPGGSCIDPAS